MLILIISTNYAKNSIFATDSMDKEKIINKTMDLEDLKSERALQIMEELNELINNWSFASKKSHYLN